VLELDLLGQSLYNPTVNQGLLRRQPTFPIPKAFFYKLDEQLVLGVLDKVPYLQ
jgi:hypothetical protein